MNCECMLLGEETNRSGATSDLITETAIPACDNLMTVLHPRHIKDTSFNHRRLLWTSVAQDSTIVLTGTKRWVLSAALLLDSLSLGLCFCPSYFNFTPCLPFIIALHHCPHIWLSSSGPLWPCFSLHIMISVVSLQRDSKKCSPESYVGIVGRSVDPISQLNQTKQAYHGARNLSPLLCRNNCSTFSRINQ